MFIIKNAIKNIYRYKSKYIMFGILYFIVILSASVCVNIFMQMGKVTDNILKEYASVVRFNGRLSSNPDNMSKRITKYEFWQFNGMEHIDDMKFFKYNFIVFSKLTEENMTNSIKEDMPELKRELLINGEIIPLGFPLKPVFVFGYNTSLLHLATDEFTLEKGRMFEKDYECVISKNRLTSNFGRLDEDSGEFIESKDWNDLDIDDKIILRNDNNIYKEFTVVGIKEQNPTDDINTNRWMIYTTFESAEYFDDINSENNVGYSITTPNMDNNNFDRSEVILLGYDVLIYLDSPDNFYVLREEMINRGVWIEPLFPNFQALLNLTSNMKSWSIIFMILTGLIIVSVTIISTTIFFNTRRYEIAVLRSVGMKKSQLIINYLIENLTFIWGITIISIIAAQFISRIFTDSVFVGMQDIISAENVEKLTQGINVGTLMQNIGLVFGGTTTVVMFSLILACINIIKFEPLKIFNKQY